MSGQKPTEGEEGGGYSYDNSRYGDEEQQRYLLQSYSQQGYPQQPYPQQGYLQQQYPQYQQYPQQPPRQPSPQQYPQQPPRQPSPQQYPHQPSSVSPFQRSLPPRQPTPPQKFSSNNSFLDDSRSNGSYSDEEGTGKSHVHKDGWLYRPPENGHVITKGEVISRIVQYYEMFAVNVFLLGYNVLKDAKLGVDGSTEKDFLVNACGDRFHIEQFDYCAASRLFWGLIGGAIVYFVFTSIVAFALSIELRRKGFYSSFTALWHSPAFLLCFFYPQEKRVDILSIPNKYVGLSLWTRSHVHRISLAIYCAICSILILVSLNKGTAETATIEGEGLDEGIHRFYNPYLIPYYLALYIFSKTLVNMLLTIIQDKDIRNNPERIGRYYLAIKDDKINK